MFRSLALSGLQRFGARYDYDVSYFRYTLDTSLSSFLRFSLLKLLSGNRGPIPKSPWFTARIRAALAEDCGPCVQLASRMALEAGVTPEVIHKVLAQEYESLAADIGLACRYADLTVARSPEADALRGEIVARWGDAGLVSLAMGISTVRVYPLYKQALGYGKSCELIELGPDSIMPKGIALGGSG